MRDRNRPRTASQAGFSMIEMLMTAFVLAVGLLGLCMLQTLSLRASRGSRSLNTAVQVASGVMDRVEMEGRLSWLNLTDNPVAAPSIANLPNLLYIPLALGASLNQSFNLQGGIPTASPDPTISTPFFTVVTKHVNNVGTNAGVGQISDYSVTVTFSDTLNATAGPVTRQVVLTRRIIHG